MKSVSVYWKNNYVKVFLLGLLTSFLFFLPFLIMDGGYFLYYGDFNVQQIPFYSLAHDAVRSGEIGWNWNTDLGANFIGSYSFYLLGSPFFWITLLFPSGAVPYLMAPLLMLKFALTGVTGYAFIRRFTKTGETAVIGALLYAFSGFNLYNIFFNHFNEAVLVFPLLLIGMEEFMVNNRRGGFALAVGLCALINYYFFFGQVLFCILYFMIRSLSGAYRITWKKFLLFALEAVLGVLLAGILLLPSFWSVIGNPRTGDTLTGFDLLLYNNVQRYGLILSSFFFPPDIPARPNLFPDSNSKWSSVSMWLPLFSTTGVFAFFMGKRKHWLKRLLMICFLVCFIPGLNAAFSLFNYSYYARWFYMPLLMMALATCIALEDHPDCFRPAIKWTAGFVAGFTLIGILPKKVNGELQWFQLPEYPERFWAYILIAAVGLICVSMLMILTTKSRYFQKFALVSVCFITVASSIFMLYTGKMASGFEMEGNGKRTYYNQVVNEALNGREKLHLEDDSGFYRIDTYDELDNLGMFWKIPTINAFQSVVPPSIMEYYKLIGGERGVGSRPDLSLPGVRALTSVKYRFVRETKAESSLLGFSYWDTQNGYKIYRNDYFIPMGVTYDYFVTENQMTRCPKTYKDRLLIKGLLLSDEDREKYKDVLPVLSNEEAGEDQLQDDDFLGACDFLSQNAIESFTVDKNGFSASAALDKENLVFFSVPWEKGWSASVNGEKAEIVKANGGFMAVLVPAGSSQIRFDYQTPGLPGGVLISLGGGALLLGYWLLMRKIRRDHPEERYRRYAHRCSEEFLPPIPVKRAFLKSIAKPDPPEEKEPPHC